MIELWLMSHDYDTLNETYIVYVRHPWSSNLHIFKAKFSVNLKFAPKHHQFWNLRSKILFCLVKVFRSKVFNYEKHFYLHVVSFSHSFYHFLKYLLFKGFGLQILLCLVILVSALEYNDSVFGDLSLHIFSKQLAGYMCLETVVWPALSSPAIACFTLPSPTPSLVLTVFI